MTLQERAGFIYPLILFLLHSFVAHLSLLPAWCQSHQSGIWGHCFLPWAAWARLLPLLSFHVPVCKIEAIIQTPTPFVLQHPLPSSFVPITSCNELSAQWARWNWMGGGVTLWRAAMCGLVNLDLCLQILSPVLIQGRTEKCSCPGRRVLSAVGGWNLHIHAGYSLGIISMDPHSNHGWKVLIFPFDWLRNWALGLPW